VTATARFWPGWSLSSPILTREFRVDPVRTSTNVGYRDAE